MNEKIQFLTNPTNQRDYIVLVPKEENNAIIFNYRKLSDEEKVPSEYLENNEFDKALDAFLAIKKMDSLDSAINEGDLNRLGYRKLGDEKYAESINIFRINVALYPESENVYDSLADAYLHSGDSLNAFANYTKAIELNSGNTRAKKYIKAYKKPSK